MTTSLSKMGSPTFLSPPPLVQFRTFITNPSFSRLWFHHPTPRHLRYTLTATTARKTSSKTSNANSTKKGFETDTALVIVESPAKAATIQKILPTNRFRVRSCVGHIREIPSSAKRIPSSYKHLQWARLGVDVTSDFQPIYVVIEGKHSVIRQLKSELCNAKQLILATDDDREGEAISWHLLEVLKPKVPVHRAVFHEITPQAIQTAFENFRTLDMALVDAQETRRILDRLAGYTMSPLLWKKIARGLSAGRVQSVAMSAVVRREIQRLQFRAAQYFDCVATFRTHGSKSSFSATLSSVSGIRLVRGADFDDSTGQLKSSLDRSLVKVFSCARMRELSASIYAAKVAHVLSIDCKRTSRHPPLPLITSTLQQECGNRLGMGAGKTMSVAQKLYETGVITYMRTDNPALSTEGVAACRNTIAGVYGSEALWNGEGPLRSGKPKAAQAAHEAIRPTGDRFPTPEELVSLSDEERAVYAIIYRRTLGSQMMSAKLDQTSIIFRVDLDEGSTESRAEFRASGSVVVEAGFLKVHEDYGSVCSSTILPPLSNGDKVEILEAKSQEHETKGPPRFNDASLVKVLEEQGVGRPSTYAGIIEKLILRGYIFRGRALPAEKNVASRALVPSLTAFAVDKLLSTHFPSFVDAQFTARMERVLDEISTGSAHKVSYLQEYYSGENGLAESVARKENTIDAQSFKQIILPNMPREMIIGASSDNDLERIASKARKSDRATDVSEDWSNTKILVNSYGPYVEQNGTVVASLPKFTLAEDLCEDNLKRTLQIAKDPVLGTDPETQMAVLLKMSRYGPYIQLGRDEDFPEGTKPKRCGLLPDMEVEDVTLDIAIQLLSLPRLLGTHNNNGEGEEVRAAIGPYGPYVVRGSTYVSLRKDRYNVLDIDLETATMLLDASEERKRKRLEKLEETERSGQRVQVTKSNVSQSKKAENLKSEKKRKSKRKETSVPGAKEERSNLVAKQK